MSTSRGDLASLLDAATEAVVARQWRHVVSLTTAALAIDPADPVAVGLMALAERQLREDRTQPEAERRFLTVAFVDLVGSTAISERLDPEDFRDLLERFQQIVRDTVGGHGGFVAKLLGDGAIVYFGYPTAREDAPRRACLSGLELISAMEAAGPEFRTRFGAGVSCRVGIHSGVTVVGSLGDGEARTTDDVVGDVPNIAARLQGIAEPGWVLISGTTFRLVEGHFATQPLGSRQIRGLSASVDVHRVVASSDLHVRLDAFRRSPFVGRETELALLTDRWRESEHDLILIRGEAGIGKSRLLDAFRAAVTEQEGPWLDAACSEYRSASAFHAFTDMIERELGAAGIAPDDHATVADTFHITSDHARMLASLVVGTDPGPELGLGPAQIRRRTVEALGAWISARTDRRIPVLAVEDLHWADPSTLEVLGYLGERGSTMVVATARPGFSPPPDCTVVDLQPLDPSAARALVEFLAGTDQLDERLRQLIVDKTDGVPLFVEELVRTLEDAAPADRTQPTIPGTLHDLLASRLDQLGAARRTAQVAAVVGRSFPPTLLADVEPGLGEDLDDHLGRLVASGLLTASAGVYSFRHSLIQDTAYGSLLRRHRRKLHARVASAITRRMPEVAERSPEVVAHHLTEAGDAEPAVSAWLRSGRVAAARSAHEEAIRHYRRALDLLEHLPETTRLDTELEIQVSLGPSLTAGRGYASPEVEDTYRRAAALADRMGDAARTFRTTWGLSSVYLLRADIAAARELMHEALHLARRAGDAEGEVEARAWLGTILFFAADAEDALGELDLAARSYQPDRDRRHGLDYGLDPLVLADSHRAWLLWLRGSPRAATALIERTVAHARNLEHPLSIAHALNYAAGLHHLRRDYRAMERVAVEEVALATEHGFPHYASYGAILAARATPASSPAEAVESLREALAARRATGAALALPYHLTMMAELDLVADRPTPARDRLGEAEDAARRTGERWWLPEVLRLQAVTLDRLGHRTEALRRTLDAAAVAHDLGATSLEVRSLTQAARFDPSDDTRHHLSAALARMTEYDDTADLREATLLASTRGDR